MFVIPGIATLLTYIYLRLHELFDVLRPLTINNILLLVGLGYLLDLRTGATRLRVSLLFVLGLAFFTWTFLTIAVKAPTRFGEHLPFITASLAAFLFTSQGVQSFRGFRVSTNILLALTIFMTAVGIHQGLSPKVCMVYSGEVAGVAAPKSTEPVEDRPCENRGDCREGDTTGREYMCESRGLLDTHSIGGRVRFRGVFQDPNELAWVASMGLPFVFTWFERRRNLMRLLGAGLAVAAVTVCTIMTQSRSGQIALAATLGTYFIRRMGGRGAVLAALVALPVLLLGGRSGEEADSSSQERLECWSEALTMWRENPFMGVGAKQFTEHHYLTAHNSFLLVLAEMGPFGLLVWTLTLYVAFKIVIQIQRDFAGVPAAENARSDAFAVFAGLVSMTVSTFFLSIAYHPAVWIEFGLVGIVQAAVWRHDPDWELRWSWRDVAFVVAFDVVLVAGVALYLKSVGV